MSTQALIERVNAVAFWADNFVRPNVVDFRYSKQTGKVEFFSWLLKPETVLYNIRKGVPQVYYSVKIRITETGSSGSRGFKLNTNSTATGTPLVERHEVADIKLH